jgi:hypothetical protein
MPTQPHKSDSNGVDWEMVVRYPWDEHVSIELRAISKSEFEIAVMAKNQFGPARGSRTVTFGDVRKALDELERAAQEVEQL